MRKHQQLIQPDIGPLGIEAGNQRSQRFMHTLIEYPQGDGKALGTKEFGQRVIESL
jgi:hypothetical protein